jgi:hypothetical protein
MVGMTTYQQLTADLIGEAKLHELNTKGVADIEIDHEIFRFTRYGFVGYCIDSHRAHRQRQKGGEPTVGSNETWLSELYPALALLVTSPSEFRDTAGWEGDE